MSKDKGQKKAKEKHVRFHNNARLEAISRLATQSFTDNNDNREEQVTKNAVSMLVNLSKLLSVNINDTLEDTYDTDDAYIVRRHKDTWCSVRMGRCMFLLCIGAASASCVNPSVLVMDMETGKIVFKSDDEIIGMIRETSEIPDGITDDAMMFDYARNEYI